MLIIGADFIFLSLSFSSVFEKDTNKWNHFEELLKQG
jgi:hypothetical protein